MQVAVDARIALYNNSGIGRYLRGLLSSLKGLPDLSAEITLLKSWRDQTSRIKELWPKRLSLLTPPHSRLEKLSLDLELRRKQFDLLHCVDFFTPVSSVPLLLTVHDLYFLKEPASLDSRSYNHYRQLIEFLPRAKHVVCISKATRSDLLELTSIEPNKISVIYPGFDDSLLTFREGDEQTSQASHDSTGEIILSVGTLEPRKNYRNLLSAYVKSYTHLKDRLCPLVIVGRKGYQGDQIASLIDEAAKLAPVSYLGEVSESELSSLYSRAASLLYPSSYEGFGFPLLEAMASNTSIITSDNSAMAEVAGECAFLVEADREESITEAIIKSVEDQDLRSRKLQLGSMRLKEFTWERSAAAHNDLYRQLESEIR